MAHDDSRSPRLLRGWRRADAARAQAHQDAQGDLVLVHSWLRRCLPREQAEDLSVAVLARAAAPGPACVAAAPRETRLQYLSVQAVLRARGVV